MRHQKFTLLLFTCSLFSIVLYANVKEPQFERDDAPTTLVDEMLIKPSYLEFEDSDLDDSLTLQESDPNENATNPLRPDFLATLQANAGAGAPMSQMVSTSDGANTWIPKFVWIGDIQDKDELKCFAAFLIGSLANKEGGATKAASPGFFMTPQTLPSNTAQVNSTLSSLNQSTPKLETTLPHSSELISRRSSSPPPAEMPIRSRAYAELEAGLGFLYFSGISGNLIPEPTRFFNDIAATNSANTPPANYTTRGRIQYNRTLLLTADIGFRLTNFVAFAITLQSQQGIHLRTKPIESAFNRNVAASNEQSTLTLSHFEADLDLYSIGGKLLFSWNNMIKFNTWSMSLFLGGSAAGGWQSWTKVKGVQSYFNNIDAVANTMTSADISFRSKYFANFTYTGDAGLIFTPTNIYAKTSLRLGCKFIGWGSARGLGAWRSQNDIFRTASAATGDQAIAAGGPIRFNYFKPLRIKTIYSWAPYIGFKWEF